MPGKGREDAKLGARATDLADSGCGRSVIWTACRVRRRARPIAEQPHRASGDGTAAFARAEPDPGPHNHTGRQRSESEAAPGPRLPELPRGTPTLDRTDHGAWLYAHDRHLLFLQGT